MGRVKEWLLDKSVDYINKKIPVDPNDHRIPSYDWCRFRRDSVCYFPAELDEQASQEAGYAVWVPFNRGECPRQKWDEQKACPVGEPGPNSHDVPSYLDATVPWSYGGQREEDGGRPPHIRDILPPELGGPPPGKETQPRPKEWKPGSG